MLWRRSGEAGIERLHPHQLRHYFAHAWLAEGGTEGDLMMLAGWRTRTMVTRYAASNRAERARDAHRRFKEKPCHRCAEDGVPQSGHMRSDGKWVCYRCQREEKQR